MPVQSCPNNVDQCLPCNDAPLVNLSAEATDLPTYFAITHYRPQIPGNDEFTKQGCKSWCFSTVSQEEADACALAQAQDCVVNPGPAGGPCSGICTPGGDDDGDQLTFYSSDVQTCNGTCGDGSTITYTLFAGAYRSLISLADANAKAAAICRERLRNIGSAFCADLTPTCFDSLAETSTEYQYLFPQTGGSPPWSYTVVGGSLPAGFALESNGYLHGFPAVAGLYPFTFNAVDQLGASVTRSVTLQIVEITSPVELTDASVGTAYTETLTQSGGIAPVSWQIVADVGEGLPPGLTLNETTGVISGTPTEDPEMPDDGIYHFRVRFQDQAT